MAGLDSLADAPTVARIVMAATGETPNDLRIVGRGVTSIGWRVDTDGGAYCVLVAVPRESYQDASPGTDAQFEARSAVLAALHKRDTRCPRPIATDRSPGIPESLAASRWMVSTWIEGDPASTPLPDVVARDAGEVTAALHALPARGYGLLVDTAEGIRGREDEPGADLTSRWGVELWPYDGRPLMTHPIVQAAPRLALAAGALREQLLGYAGRTARAVCHTDLNPSHFLVRDGRLAGIIAFGDAAVAPPAFDIASFAFFGGWEKTERFLEGYASNSVLRDLRRAEAYQLAVVLALQKVHKHTKLKPDAERLARAVAFLEETLPLATRRSHA
ncbi:MAG: aminoglycoside phosphotransferase family protein [Dehalococcoidia bacterium]|nr:aminoglycoside phosphotransferase family protein [Dehalococcoidia bacterium]